MRTYEKLQQLELQKSEEIELLIKPIIDKYKPLIDAFYEVISEDYLIENEWIEKGRYFAGGHNEYHFEKNNKTIRFNKKTKSIMTYCGKPTRSIINKEDLEDYANGFY